MLDYDLAIIYQVETRVFNQAVKRNIDRFPPEFMFQLTKAEFDNLKSQFVIWGGRRKLPLAFTLANAYQLFHFFLYLHFYFEKPLISVVIVLLLV